MKKQLVKITSNVLSVAANSFSKQAKIFVGSLPVPKELRKK
ncbi:hypothetical protein ABE142_07425 [Paenibacillus alvei]|nr:hypothetical protein [Paenibacillus alvei]EJW18163.1 hypothetical protein PAV_3c06140 [Paenibacillus alvei DSM 29]MEC0080387.1 hypothetical protein [Paenibacillus alvei]